VTFEEAWRRCGPWIAAALARAPGGHTLDDVRTAVERGEARLWVGARAAMVTEIHEMPRLKVLHFWLAGGDLVELRDEMRPLAEAWGREQGCALATITGRKGWARALGYQAIATVCAKELS
jgi:hypothetical protein